MRVQILTALVFGAAAIAACGETSSPTLAAIGGSSSSNGGTTALAIIPSQASMVVGGQLQLSTNAPETLQNQVEWSSQQTTVAATSPSGLITAVGTGTATITARFASDTTNVATATIVVRAR